MNKEKKQYLAEMARKIRVDTIKAIHSAKAGHPGGSLSIAEILSYLYFEEMNIDPKDPKRKTATASFCRRDTLPQRCTRRSQSADFSIRNCFSLSARTEAFFRATPI